MKIVKKCVDCKGNCLERVGEGKYAYSCEKGHFTTEDVIDVEKETLCEDFEHKLKYPVGSFISYCDEYYKVLTNHSDHSGRVVDMGGDTCTNFYFKCYGEDSVLITDEAKIEELEVCLTQSLAKNKAEYDRIFKIDVSERV